MVNEQEYETFRLMNRTPRLTWPHWVVKINIFPSCPCDREDKEEERNESIEVNDIRCKVILLLFNNRKDIPLGEKELG